VADGAVSGVESIEQFAVMEDGQVLLRAFSHFLAKMDLGVIHLEIW
jgi:hypothetical protein